MKTKITVLLATACIVLSGADAPPTNRIFAVPGATYNVRYPVVTNLSVVDMCVETDLTALPKFRVSPEGLTNIIRTLIASGLACAPARNQPKTLWFNDAVYYENYQVSDDERNKTNTESYVFYMKEVAQTNKVTPFYFRAGDQPIELGARDDGIIVWRRVK